MSWSPRGLYLATFHRMGVMLWGGPSWKKVQKLTLAVSTSRLMTMERSKQS